jgi:hypothetical protein
MEGNGVKINFRLFKFFTAVTPGEGFGKVDRGSEASEASLVLTEISSK